LCRITKVSEKIYKSSNTSTNRRHCASRLPPFKAPRLFSGRSVTLDTPFILLILQHAPLDHCPAGRRNDNK
jgi:hypothetical protein